MTDELGPAAAAYLARLRDCATSLGRDLAPIPETHLVTRVDEGDAELAERGFASGLLRIDGNYVWTQDPHQATAWLVEGNPARPCWEYLPHLASYVELVQGHRYPVSMVRFETPEPEFNLDIAVLSPDGGVMVLGEVKREATQLDAITRHLGAFTGDPGKPDTVRSGGPHGTLREAWKLAHQLWQTGAPYLWLVAAGTRRTFTVEYRDHLVLHPAQLPAPEELWPDGHPDDHFTRIGVAAH